MVALLSCSCVDGVQEFSLGRVDGGVEVSFKDAQRTQIEFECEKPVVGGVKLLVKGID